MKSNIDWRELHGLGFSLIPVHVGKKIPAIAWTQYKTRRASLEEIATWEQAGHNSGIVTGAISSIFVLDCDTPEAVALALKLGIPENGVSVGTAKGKHFYFRYPDFSIPNKTNFLPGMDIRGEGGFVVAPGSIHPSGVVYVWANQPSWNEIPPSPEWLLDRLHRDAPVKSEMPVVITAKPYGRSALDRELTILRNTATGGRNHQLNRSAFALAQLAAGGQIDSGEALTALRHAAQKIGLENLEIEVTLASGWQAGLQEPRGPQQSEFKAKQSRPAIFDARALSEMSFPPLRWAIPGLLPEGLAVLAGKPKLGKSFLSLQMAIAVATGNGGAFGVPEVDEGDVLVCALEDSPRRLKDRLVRMWPFGAPERLQFATGWPRLDSGGIAELEHWCNQHPNARLVIVDTWRAIKPPGGGRGSAYDEDATAAAPLLDFVKLRPGLTVLVIHHARKADAEDVFDTISGTHGLTGIFDTLMVLVRHGEGAMLAAQGRDLDGYEKALERDRRTGGWIVRGDAIPLAKTGERQALLDVLAKVDEPLSLSQIAHAVGKKPDAARHLLKPLVYEGSVYQPGHGRYALRPSQLPQDIQFDEQEYAF
jgi:hypothetical protein